MPGPADSFSAKERLVSVEEAQARLADAGYHLEFEAADGMLWCRTCAHRALAADVVIEAIMAVSGQDGTPAGDLYALDCLTCGVKGVWWVEQVGLTDQVIRDRSHGTRSVAAAGPPAAPAPGGRP